MKDGLALVNHPGRSQPYTIWVTDSKHTEDDRVVRFCSTIFEVRWWTERLERDLEVHTKGRSLPSGVR